MIREYDPLVYRHPRTMIDAFGCDADSAIAGTVYRPSIARRLRRYTKIVAMVLVAVISFYAFLAVMTALGV